MAARSASADTRKSAFRIRAGSLKAALGDIAGVVSPKNTIPICATVRLQAGDGLLTLSATNLDTWATRTLATDDRQVNSEDWRASIRPFAVCAPGKPLLEILGLIDADALVTIEATDEASATIGGPVRVTAGRSRWTLKGLPSADFPVDAQDDAWGNVFVMKASGLADSLAVVEHAVSSEETRYYLNGVYLHVDGLDLTFAATDGSRLSQLKIDAPEGAITIPSTIVPRGVVSILDKVLPRAGGDGQIEVALTESGKLMRFDMPCGDDGELVIVAKAIDGTFPDYTRVIPARSDKVVTVGRDTLLSALKRVAVMADNSRVVRFEAASNKLTLTATSVELGEASEEVPCDFDGELIAWGFDSRFLRDALGAVAADSVKLLLTDPAAPVRVEAHASDDAPRLVQVVMPYRV